MKLNSPFPHNTINLSLLIYFSLCQNKSTIKLYIQIIAKLTGSVIGTCTTIPVHLYYKQVTGKLNKDRKEELKHEKHVQPRKGKIRAYDTASRQRPNIFLQEQIFGL